MTNHLTHLISQHYNHHKNSFASTKKSTEPLKPIVDKPPNNDQDESSSSSSSHQSGQWEKTELCNQRNNTFQCQCKKGCQMEEHLTDNTKIEACICFEERICAELNDKTKEWEETKTDSYKKSWSDDIKTCKALQQ